MSGSSTLPRCAAGVAISSIAAIASIVALSGLRAEVAAQPITLEQALERAAARPLVGMASASAEAARGEAENAALPAYNPQLTGAVGPRFTGGGQRAVSWEVGLSQTFQLGGKRASRRAIAAAQVAGADAELAAAAVLARIEAWSAFQRALISRERVAMALEAEQVAIQVDAATKERQQVGFGTQLEVNLTTSEVGRARHDRLDAERRSAEAIAALASAIGAPGSAALEPVGRLETTGALAASVEDLVARALRGRPEIRIARASSSLAQAEQRAADASAVPDLALGVSYAYERDPDFTARTVLATAAIDLPILSRNQGKRRAARALSARAELEVGRVAMEVERELRLAAYGYQRARDAVLGFDREVNERLHENLELARESYTSGKIDYFQFNVVRRELLAGRNAYLDALEELVDAWSALSRATGGEVAP